MHPKLAGNGVIGHREALAAEHAEAGRREYASEQGAENAADTVHRKHIQGIVDLHGSFHEVRRREAHEASCNPDDQRASGTHKARCRRDGAQASHHAGHCAEGTRLAVPPPFQAQPGECPGRCRHMGHQHRHRRVAVRRQRTAAIEAEPTHPKHAGTGHCHRHVVGHHSLVGETTAPPHHERTHQRGHPRRDVHDDATCEVHDAQFRQPSTAPHPMGNGAVHEQQPQR